MIRKVSHAITAAWLCAGAALASQPVFVIPPAAPGGLNPVALPPSACLGATEPPESTSEHIIAGLLAQIEGMDPQPDPLLQALARTDTSICLVPPPLGARGYFEPDDDQIVLRSDLSRGEMQAILVHELRHMEQVSRGFCPSPVLDMQEVARLQLAMEADAQAVATLYAWGLAQQGHPETWQAMLAFEHYADITHSFEQSMAQTDDIGLATAAAFAQWYESDWRTEAYYVSSCADHLDRLDQDNLPPGYARMPDGFLAQLCHLPSGRSYDCEAANRFER